MYKSKGKFMHRWNEHYVGRISKIWCFLFILLISNRLITLTDVKNKKIFDWDFLCNIKKKEEEKTKNKHKQNFTLNRITGIDKSFVSCVSIMENVQVTAINNDANVRDVCHCLQHFASFIDWTCKRNDWNWAIPWKFCKYSLAHDYRSA